MRRAYTLIELLIVIAVIVVLIGMLFPAIASVRARTDIDATRALIHGAVTALAGTGTRQVTCRDGQLRNAWAIGQVPPDTEMDGDPRSYPPTHPLVVRAPASYTGPVAMVGVKPTLGINARGQVLDRWRQPLHIVYAVRTYLPDGYGLWSLGPHGAGDEINSWTNAEK